MNQKMFHWTQKQLGFLQRGQHPSVGLCLFGMHIGTHLIARQGQILERTSGLHIAQLFFRFPLLIHTGIADLDPDDPWCHQRLPMFCQAADSKINRLCFRTAAIQSARMDTADWLHTHTQAHSLAKHTRNANTKLPTYGTARPHKE